MYSALKNENKTFHWVCKSFDIFQKRTQEEGEVVEQLLVQVLLWVQMSQMNLKLIKLQQEAQDHGKNLDGLGAQLKILNLRHQVLRVIYNKLYLSQSTLYRVSYIEVCFLKVLKNIENTFFIENTWAYFQKT